MLLPNVRSFPKWILTSICFLNITANAQLFPTNFNWAYQLQDLDPIVVSGYQGFNVLVMDYSKDGSQAGQYTPAEIAQLKNSGTKVLAYLSIGEAEDYRDYWQSGWTTGNPSWLGVENPDWAGNYKVKFWEPEWKQIVFTYLDTIINQGFDGVYLDIIDGWYYWKVELGSEPQADSLMGAFVKEIRNYLDENSNTTKFIVPQNGEDIIREANFDKTSYFNAIDGIGIEDVFFNGSQDEDNLLNPDAFRLDVIQEYQQAGKPVLSIEYLTDPFKIVNYRSLAQTNLFHPYACTRALDHICLNSIQSIKSPTKVNPIVTISSQAIRIELTDDSKLNEIQLYDFLGRNLHYTKTQISQTVLELRTNEYSGNRMLVLKTSTSTSTFKFGTMSSGLPVLIN